MISWIKKYFIPHEGNDYRPYFLHGKNARTIVILLLLLELIVFMIPTLTFVGVFNNSNLATVIPVVLTTLINEERTHGQLENLTVSPILDQAAQMKAEDMAKKSYFAHTSPDGQTMWNLLDTVQYRYDYAGENLAINFTDSQDVVIAWINSPTHRANIVKSSYREVGTGLATGIYEGKETLFVVQVYANPQTAKPTLVAYKEEPVQASNILGAEINPIAEPTVAKPNVSKPTVIEKVTASPRNTFNTLLYVIIALMLVALLLNVSIKFKVQHTDLITNGLAVLAIVGAIFVTNNLVSNRGATISHSEYSSEQVQSEYSF